MPTGAYHTQYRLHVKKPLPVLLETPNSRRRVGVGAVDNSAITRSGHKPIYALMCTVHYIKKQRTRHHRSKAVNINVHKKIVAMKVKIASRKLLANSPHVTIQNALGACAAERSFPHKTLSGQTVKPAYNGDEGVVRFKGGPQLTPVKR